jgi:hypothetical protein
VRPSETVKRETITPVQRPLIRPAPRSAMFFPLVVVSAILPGLYALNWWDLIPPGPWWGMRGLAILEGQDVVRVQLAGAGAAGEAAAYQVVAMQPPLYAWLEAAAFALSPDRDPLATVLPSYLAGVAIVLLIYLHGKVWLGRGTGLIAALLTAFHRDLLVQMQQASPSTLATAGLLGALLCYAQHFRGEHRRGWLWMLLGGVSLGVSLLSVGLIGLMAVPVILLHQVYLGLDRIASRCRCESLARRVANPSVLAGVGALALAAAIAAPWHWRMYLRHGDDFLLGLFNPPSSLALSGRGLLTTLLTLAPATLPLGALGAYRAIRRALTCENDSTASTDLSFWLLWLAFAALLPALWPQGPAPTMLLALLIPLNLLAAHAISELAARRISVRSLTRLAPATACTLAWWFSSDLRHALESIAHGQRPSPSTAIGLHLGVDVAVLLSLLTRRLDHWAKRSDDRRRLVLGGFMIAICAVVVGTGLREVRFRHRETVELLDLRNAIVRNHHAKPFTVVAVVAPGANSPASLPGGRLRFILRTALPHLEEIDLHRSEELRNLPEGQRLVIFAGSDQRMPYSLQSYLDLEMIHPGHTGVLDAFATTRNSQGRARR